MADKKPASSSKDVQDPARTYERAKPEAESGMGRLDNNDATPDDQPDRIAGAVPNRQKPYRQINAQDQSEDHRRIRPDGSMPDEAPDGWDMAPTNLRDPRQKRHRRTQGKGGVP